MKTRKETWDPQEAIFSPERFNLRIKQAVHQRHWRRAVAFFAESERPFDTLKIAEVGCGTGTFSLTFCLLGASATLFDFNGKALERTRQIYSYYGCRADYVMADCLKPVPEELVGKFDLVFSGGLAEHFSGESRKDCIRYHVSLLKKGGLCCIEVPNRVNPFYRSIVFFRKLTNTWAIDLEIPFTVRELKEITAQLGLRQPRVIGYTDLMSDSLDGMRGLFSAVTDGICPGFKAWIKEKLNAGKCPSDKAIGGQPDMKDYCVNMAKECLTQRLKGKEGVLDRFCSHIVLIATR